MIPIGVNAGVGSVGQAGVVVAVGALRDVRSESAHDEVCWGKVLNFKKVVWSSRTL